MLFGARKKVDEDLEKIRFANLTVEEQEREINKQKAQKKEIESIQYEKNDRLALILAVFSIVLPYFLFFIAIILIFVGVFYVFF